MRPRTVLLPPLLPVSAHPENDGYFQKRREDACALLKLRETLRHNWILNRLASRLCKTRQQSTLRFKRCCLERFVRIEKDCDRAFIHQFH